MADQYSEQLGLHMLAQNSLVLYSSFGLFAAQRLTYLPFTQGENRVISRSPCAVDRESSW